MMMSIDSLQPVSHPQLYLYSSLNYNFHCSHGLSFFPCKSRALSCFGVNTARCRSETLYRPARFSKKSENFNLWEGFRKSHGLRESGVRANSPERDSNAGSAEESEVEANESKGVNPSPPNPTSPATNPREEKQGKGGWSWWWSSEGGKWPWLPKIQAKEVRMLLLPLGFVLFIMPMLRPGLWFQALERSNRTTVMRVPYSDFLSKIRSNQVQKVEVDGDHIAFKLRQEMDNLQARDREAGDLSKLQETDSSLLRSVAPTRKIVYTTTQPFDVRAPYEKMLENEVEFGAPDKRDKKSNAFLDPKVITVFCIILLVTLFEGSPLNVSQTAGQLRRRRRVGLSSAKESEQGKTITFADVAGVDEAKEELAEIVEFLRNPDRYERLGARPPRGVLLVGLPGTGKTLLAKAVAGEADVPFISCSASEFVELYVGMGASRVRDMFQRAKRVAPSIIFIDEIDAVARSRDGKRFGSNDEREQTLNQLLTEMDGFDTNSAVIVLGATNRSDVLDPAIQRPGRFDRVVTVEAPDRTGREAILKVHVANKELPLGDDVDLSNIASMTTGFTGADLANLVNEAALLAGRQNKVVVEKVNFIQAVERSIAGIEKKTSKLQQSEKAVVARHEAGHAVVGTAVANLLPGQPHVEKLSILPRSGGALGFTYTPPTHEDRYLLFIDELRGRLVTLLGGRAAEEIIYSGRVSTGALDDIRRATDMAYKAVAEYGLNQTIGPISVSALCGGGIDGSGGSALWGRDQGHVVDLVQIEVKALLQSALDVALSVMRANPTVLEGLGAHLEDKEKVEGEELKEWLKLVVAPAELAIFIRGEQSLLPVKTGS